MADPRLKSADRRPRADALRNRERLLEVAREAFGRSGAEVCLDEVARAAGVGPGTLYRHFPTRDALLEAVYRVEVEKLAEAERELSRTMAPVDALRAWMMLFVDFIAAKQIIAPALNSLVGEPDKLCKASAQIVGAITALVERAIESGDVRPDLAPCDLLCALVGVSNVASAPNWPESAKRLVEMLVLGSRPTR